MACEVTAVSRLMASTVGHLIASFHFNVDVRSIPLNAVQSGSMPPGRPMAAWVEASLRPGPLLIQGTVEGGGNSVEQREVVYMGLLFS